MEGSFSINLRNFVKLIDVYKSKIYYRLYQYFFKLSCMKQAYTVYNDIKIIFYLRKMKRGNNNEKRKGTIRRIIKRKIESY